MFVMNYYQSNVTALCCNLIPKHSFCNTVCVCMVKQIKLVVVVARFFECHQCCVGLASVSKEFQ